MTCWYIQVGESKTGAGAPPSKLTGRKVAVGSRGKPAVGIANSSKASVRSQSAPPSRSVNTAPKAIALPNSKQQKVTLLQAKHASNRARTEDRVKAGRVKASQVVKIPKAMTKKPAADLSLSLNSTSDKIATWHKK